MAETGRLLRFDELRGYGFIVPDKGGEDVFIHINEFCDDKDLLTAGIAVEYEVAEGERGLKAFAVHVVAPEQTPAPVPAPTPTPAPKAIVSTSQGEDDVLADVLTQVELEHEFTDLVLNAVGDLTGAQILRLRGAVAELARRHGWLEEPAVPTPMVLAG